MHAYIQTIPLDCFTETSNKELVFQKRVWIYNSVEASRCLQAASAAAAAVSAIGVVAAVTIFNVPAAVTTVATVPDIFAD